MSFPQAIFLSVIQGLTEFLPISSSGHLVIFQKIFNLDPPIWFDITLHIGTLGAVIFFLKKRLRRILEGLLRGDKEQLRLIGQLILGTAPAVLIGLGVSFFEEVIFNSVRLVGLMLLLTAFFLFSTVNGKRKKELSQLNWREILLIGFFQGLAVFPGVSRSGATLAAGLGQGLSPSAAFDFSFLLAVPAVTGAFFLKLPQLLGLPSEVLIQGGVGLVVAGVVGYFSLKALRLVLVSNKLWLFGIYCFLLGGWLFF
ncbi:MAG: undecaprenyl-diphosphate phosphatase [Candidatus Pacebacteria bacterium]|nr:undecaprenyl-diphosphate phosphatase [Candidatus Paceibacterota bacterium]